MKSVEQRDWGWGTFTYTAYGYLQNGPAALLAFNGEWWDDGLQGYALGHGYRFYCPALMRFSCPDVLSPFGNGGVNMYSYCQGDPLNRVDPTGGVAIPKGIPGRARQVALVVPHKATNYASSPALKKGPGKYWIEDSVYPELKKGPGKYWRAKPVGKRTFEELDSSSTKGFSDAPVKVSPVMQVVGVKSQGPTIDALAEGWRERMYYEHRPGTQPMSLEQMIPNHQRNYNSQIVDLERDRARIREQEERDAIVFQHASNWNG